MSSVDYYDVERMIRDAGYRYVDRDDFHHSMQDARNGISDQSQRIDELERTVRALREEVESLRNDVIDDLANRSMMDG